MSEYHLIVEILLSGLQGDSGHCGRFHGENTSDKIQKGENMMTGDFSFLQVKSIRSRFIR